jgi:hypothetical protein
MGAGGFNGRVRNGIGWNSPAMTTRPAKHGFRSQKSEIRSLKSEEYLDPVAQIQNSDF